MRFISLTLCSVQRTYLWDVTDLDAPTLESTYDSGLQSIDHNQYIIGDLTYQANYETGLRILSIDQAAPSLTEVAYFTKCVIAVDIIELKVSRSFAKLY